jgi:hypothetical protein
MNVHRSIHVGATALPVLESGQLMKLRRAAGGAVVAAGLLVAGLAVPAEAAAATVYQAPLRTAVLGLPVAAEVNAGYDRDRYFGVWGDTNGDCQNTRQEVLVQESKGAVTYTNRGCMASRGRWVTTWDNGVHTSATEVEVDHLVPVHEAWGSGARYWSQARRVAFYNDLGDSRTLNVQTAALNHSKRASGPERWLPPKNRCAYITQWVAVKIRWGLSVNITEKAALILYAASCPNVTLTVTRV